MVPAAVAKKRRRCSSMSPDVLISPIVNLRVDPRKRAAPDAGAPTDSDGLAQRPERGSKLRNEKLRLLPSREVCAFVELVVMDQLGIRPLRPTPWGRVDLVGKDTHGDRDFDAPHVEKAPRQIRRGVPVELRRRDRAVRHPIERDIVEDVVPRQPFRLSVEDAPIISWLRASWTIIQAAKPTGESTSA